MSKRTYQTTPPKIKRSLSFQSPSSTSSPSKRFNATGIICHVGQNVLSSFGNIFFDVKLKTDQVTCSTIRVMELGLPQPNIFKENMLKPVTLFNLNSKDGATFFNTKSGSKLEILAHDLPKKFSPDLPMKNIAEIDNTQSSLCNIKGTVYALKEQNLSGKDMKHFIIVDSTGDIKITIWKRNIWENIKDGVVYTVTDLTTAIYYGLKVESTKFTAFQEIDDAPLPKPADMTKYTRPVNSETVCCPDIQAGSLYSKLSCASFECHNTLSPDTNARTVKCDQCGRRSDVAKLKKSVQGNIELTSSNGDEISLEFDVSILQKYLNDYSSDLNYLEEKLVLLKGIDLKYNKKTYQILEICDHGKDDVTDTDHRNDDITDPE